PTKIGGYAVGDSIYFPPTGEKNTYLVTAAAAMGESPTTHPAKFEPVGGGDISDIEYVLEDAISGEGEDDVETIYTLNSTYWEQNGLNTNGTNGGTDATKVRLKDYREGYKVDITAVGCEFFVMFFDINNVRISDS